MLWMSSRPRTRLPTMGSSERSSETGSKVFKSLRFGHSTQASNAVANLEAFQEYASTTGKQYRFMFLIRHDLRFFENMLEVILKHPRPDDTVWLHNLHRFQYPVLPNSPEERCSVWETFNWNVRNRSSISWWASDRIFVMAGKFVPAFFKLLNGPTLLGKIGTPSAPRWPGECWAELGPLVGGHGHLSFLDESVIRICKVFNMVGGERIGMDKETELPEEVCAITSK
mmetsp:Transcript_95580/g.232362  ORF Transcript_95580/g.232362 Transcript_95580/m.232362 type:complete len:227 (+) Transcript_95580:324-1004(+)